MSQSSRLAGAIALTSLFLTPPIAEAQIALAKMNQCRDIVEVQQALLSGQVDTSRCRLPTTALEKALISRAAQGYGQLCLLQEPPAAFLANFSCVIPTRPGATQLTCFTGADLQDLANYEADYEKSFAAPTVQYLSESAQCPASNGDATYSFPTMYPPPLMLISRYQFGFISSLGKGRQTGAHIQHTFAQTDPSITNAPTALESVSIAVSGEFPAEEERQLIADWMLEVDNSDDFDREFNRLIRNRTVPFRVDGVSFDVKRRISSPTRPKDITDRLRSVLVESFEQEGFGAVDDDEFEEGTGKTYADALKQLENALPYGARKIFPTGDRPLSFAILINERRPDCAASGKGAVAAYLLGLGPDPGRRSDYGSLTLIVAGMGACARQTTNTRTYTSGLITDATEQVASALRKSP